MAIEKSNQFKIRSVEEVSADESLVMGEVLSGAIRKGSWVEFMSEKDTPVTGQVCRIGSAESPVNLIREGDDAMILLGVEAGYLCPKMIISTSAEGTYAPTMILTEIAPAQRGDLEVRPQEFIDIESLVNQRLFNEASEALEKYKPGPKFAYVSLQLRARILLESDASDALHDTLEALRLIREAYDGPGKGDGDVLETLARSLGENGEPVSGLRYLDRLYTYALDHDSRRYYYDKIMAYRRRYKVDDKWEVLNALGDVIYSTVNENEIIDGFGDERFPIGWQVRKNRIGDLVNIEDFVGGQKSEARVLVELPGGSGLISNPMNMALGCGVGCIVGLIIGLVAGISLVVGIAVGSLLGICGGVAYDRLAGGTKG